MFMFSILQIWVQSQITVKLGLQFVSFFTLDLIEEGESVQKAFKLKDLVIKWIH